MIDLHSLNWATVSLGSLGVGLVSSLWAWARGTLMSGFFWLKGRVITTLSIDEQSQRTLTLFNRWFLEHPYGKSCKRLMMKEIPGVGHRMLPAPGTHPIKWNGKRMLVTLSLKDAEKGTYGGPRQTVSIQSFSDRKFMEGFLKELQKIDEDRTGMRVYGNSGGGWDEIGELNPRPRGSLVFPSGFVDGILGDIQTFMNSEEEYAKRGLPWRRGYLFAGTPGTGKSSLIEALAGELEMNIHLLTLKIASDKNLQELLYNAETSNEAARSGSTRKCSRNSLVVIEDIDCASDSRITTTRPDGEDDDNPLAGGWSKGPSLGALLNSLDGIGAPTGRILFVTTNFPERLDPALTRPGRMDVALQFPHLTPETATQLYSLLGDLSDLSQEKFLSLAVGASPAEGRGMLLQKDILRLAKIPSREHIVRSSLDQAQ